MLRYRGYRASSCHIEPVVIEGWERVYPPVPQLSFDVADETRGFTNGFRSFGIVQNRSAI